MIKQQNEIAPQLKKLLRQVEKPGRYSGGEYGYRLPTGREEARVLFSYPDIYEIGFSNQGLKILYDCIQKRDDLYADMAFTPWPDMGSKMKEAGLPLFGLNSKLPAGDFDCWAMNLSHELLLTNILYMLDLAGLPLLRRERNSGPFIIVGGTAITNPLPLADFADGFFMGDGEEAIVEMADCLAAAKKEGLDRAETLRRLSEIKGLYIPATAEPYVDDDRRVRVDTTVEKRTFRAPCYSDLDTIMVPNLQLVQDRVVVEVNRGCGQGCRFCHAGFWKRPVRNLETTTVVEQAMKMAAKTGYSEIALHSLSIADYPFLEDLALQLSEQTGPEGLRFSFPSLRVSFKTIPVVELTQNVKKSNLTFALESGSELQRERIHKKSSEDNLIEIIKEIFDRGWSLVKVYFMLGLPGASQEDEAMGIARVLNKMAGIAASYGGRHQINTTISLFVPKPFTTYQWEEQRPVNWFLESRRMILQNVTSKRVKLSFPDCEGAWLEGILSRCDHRIGPALLQAYKEGAIFDSWSEWFNWPAWERALATIDDSVMREWVGPLDPEEYAERPWDFIKALRDGYLERDLDKARSIDEENMNPPKKQSLEDMDEKIREALAHARDHHVIPEKRYEVVDRLQLNYTVDGPLVYTGHLDKTSILQRVTRRARLPFTFTAGHHKIEKLHYGPPLPLFHSSRCETAWVDLYRRLEPAELEGLVERLTELSPEGMRFTAARQTGPVRPKMPVECSWQADFSELAATLPERAEQLQAILQRLVDERLQHDVEHWRKLAEEGNFAERYPELTLTYEQITNRLVRRKRVRKVKTRHKLIPACLQQVELSGHTLTFTTATEGSFVMQTEKLLKNFAGLTDEELGFVKIERIGLI